MNYQKFSFQLLICAFLLLTFKLFAFSQTCSPAPVGLVSWWSGDGNALDSRSRNNGTLQNGATFASGNVGQGFNFTSGTGSVDIPDSPNLDLISAGSMETWLFLNNPNDSSIIEKGDFLTNAASYTLELRSGILRFDLYKGDGSLTEIFAGTNVNPLVGSWNHVAATWDGANLRLYINGVQTNVQPYTFVRQDTPHPLVFGDGPTAQGAFIGTLDEVSLYNRVLTQAEITSIFNAGTAGKCKPTATVAPSGLVAWLAGDGNLNDISGNGNNGLLQGGANFVVGKVGQGFSFSASANSGIIVPSTPALNPTDAITLEAWVNPSSFPNPGNTVMRKDINVGTNQYNISVLNTGQALCGMGTFAFPVGGSVPLNQWSHLACTYNRQNARLYVNGVEVAAVAETQPIPQSSQRLGIGAEDGVTNSNFNGMIDEPTIYNSTLTPAEITSIFNAGIAGKLKDNTTPTGANVAVQTKSDGTVTFPTVVAAGITQQIPLNLSTLPSLPIGSTTTGLTYDIATTAVFTGSPKVCFNLPSITNATVFGNLRIAHLENNVWTNRTDLASINFATKTICTSNLTSLSPFAIVNGFAPTAASASLNGRVTTANGSGIRSVNVLLTNSNGEIFYARTGTFGYYHFVNLPVGEIYILSVRAKRYSFANPTRVINLSDDLTGEDFVAEGRKFYF